MNDTDKLIKRLKRRSRQQWVEQWVDSVQAMGNFPDEDCVNAADIIEERDAIRAANASEFKRGQEVMQEKPVDPDRAS